MPYTRDITQSHPAALLFLIDQSESMKEKFGLENKSKAEKLAELINLHLRSLTLRCNRSDGVRPYLYIGVIGYGDDVESAFSGALSGDLIPIPLIADNPITVREIEEQVKGNETYTKKSRIPIWIEPKAGNGTPMAAAFSRAEEILAEWLKEHKDSFPPVVFNITDAEYNDGEDPTPVARRISNMFSSDGSVLLFNICITRDESEPILFPSSDSSLPSAWLKGMFAISSVLPEFVRVNVEDAGVEVAPNARCFAFNANTDAIAKSLSVGTPTVAR